MYQLDAIHRLTRIDRENGACVFAKDDLRQIFNEDNESTLTASIQRLVRSGILARAVNGVYVNSLSHNKLDITENIAKVMRRGEYSYVSLESALSEYGVISQIPMVLTVITTGRRGRYDTPYGTIEFTHTKRNIPDENDGTVDVGRPFIEACYIGDIPSGLFMRTLAVAIGDTEFRSLEV